MTIKQGLFWVFFLVEGFCIGQLTEVKPDLANQNQLAFSFNPSTSFSDDELKVNLAFRNRFQDFSAIRSFYSLLTLPVNNSQTTFFELVSDQLGPHFQKNRLYLGYALGIDINDDLKTSLGFSGGVVNYNMKPTSGSSGGSDFGTDASVGVSIEHSSGVGLGMSLQQFLNREIQPIDYSFTLERFAEVQLSYKKEVNDEFKTEVLVRAFSDKSYALYSRLYWYENMLIGLNFNSRKMMAAIAGYTMEYDKEFEIGLNVAYTFSVTELGVDKRTIEFIVTLIRI